MVTERTRKILVGFSTVSSIPGAFAGSYLGAALQEKKFPLSPEAWLANAHNPSGLGGAEIGFLAGSIVAPALGFLGVYLVQKTHDNEAKAIVRGAEEYLKSIRKNS